MTRILRLALWPLAMGFGLLAVGIAHRHPEWSLAGGSSARAGVELAAGLATIAVGLVAWARSPGSRVGPLLVAGGAAWFAADLGNPDVGSALPFTVGLLLLAAAPPLVAHAALAYAGPGAGGRPARVMLVFAYTGGLVVLGLAPALAFDPAAAGCSACPANVVGVVSAPDAHDDLVRWGLWLGVAWSLGLAAVLAWLVLRGPRARRSATAPVLVPAILYLLATAGGYAHAAQRGFASNDALDRRWWLLQAAALVMLAAGVAWGWLRARRTREAVVRLLVEDPGAAGGDVRAVLAATLGDPGLRIAYTLPDGRHVDPRGTPIEPGPGDAVTTVRRAGATVALILHRRELVAESAIDESVAAARLALEHERLQAATHVQLADLRSSRARIVEAGDATRRRLERDLHDGAQQRLVGLAVLLRLARAGLGPAPAPRTLEGLDRADAEVQLALAELRELAHGLYPAALAQEGLGSALEALAERDGPPLVLRRLPDRRADGAVEAAAYFVVAELARRGDGRLEVAATCDDGRLQLDIDGVRDAGALEELEDRVGALDGRLDVAGAHVRVELPCGS